MKFAFNFSCENQNPDIQENKSTDNAYEREVGLHVKYKSHKNTKKPIPAKAITIYSGPIKSPAKWFFNLRVN